jgi:hypothetical protein
MRLDERFRVDIVVICSVVEIVRPVGSSYYKGREIIVVVVVVGCCQTASDVPVLCGRDLQIVRTGCMGRGRHSVTGSTTTIATAVVVGGIFSPDPPDQTGQEIARDEPRRLRGRLWRWIDDFMPRHL